MRVLSTVKFTALRMMRNYIVLLLLLVVPMILLTVFSFILSGLTTESGEPYIHFMASTQVLLFQLFGGSIVMYLIHHDLFSVHRTRMYALPFNQTLYAFSILVCGAIFSMLLGVALMLFAQFVLGVIWKHWAWMLIHIALIAILSIIICLIFTLSIKNYKLAERLSEVYGVGLIVLAGLFFPMPDHAFFDFMGSYGNPLTLSIMSIDEMNNGNPGQAWQLASILIAAIIFFFIVMLFAGRRRFRA